MYEIEALIEVLAKTQRIITLKLSMNINTDKLLEKVDYLLKSLKQAREKKESFKSIHEEVVNLCKIVYTKKSEYSAIDIPYPEELIINIKNSSSDEYTTINVPPDINAQLEELSKELSAVLQRIKKFYDLKKELEQKQDATIIKYLSTINKNILEIKRRLKNKK